MKERSFSSLQSVDTTEKIPLTSEGLLVGIVLPPAEARIHRSQNSPQIAITSIVEVSHDPRNSILIVIGRASNIAMTCHYFRCSRAEIVPLSFSAS